MKKLMGCLEKPILQYLSDLPEKKKSKIKNPIQTQGWNPRGLREQLCFSPKQRVLFCAQFPGVGCAAQSPTAAELSN